MSVLKFRLNRKNSSGSYDVIHYESSSNIILRPDSSTVEQGLQTLETETENLKTSVSEGKALIAAAVTDKGVTTAADATFQQIADNIAAIFQLDTSDATALASQILSGCTAYVNGSKITGTMTNRGAVSQSLNCGASYTIPAGYHNGSGKVSANSLASQTSGTATAARILSGYTAWVNGTRLTGTLDAGVSFANPLLYKTGNWSSMIISSSYKRFYVFIGSGYYWSWYRCDDASTSNIVQVTSTSYGSSVRENRYGISYDPSSRRIGFEDSEEPDGIGVIGWTS